MKLSIRNLTENPTTLFRRAGYTFQRKEGDEMSFVRPLASAGFPRFHAYAKIEKTDITVNIHLDQKKETYGKETRHHGEYDNEGPLKNEVDRLLRLFGSNTKIFENK